MNYICRNGVSSLIVWGAVLLLLMVVTQTVTISAQDTTTAARDATTTDSATNSDTATAAQTTGATDAATGPTDTDTAPPSGTDTAATATDPPTGATATEATATSDPATTTTTIASTPVPPTPEPPTPIPPTPEPTAFEFPRDSSSIAVGPDYILVSNRSDDLKRTYFNVDIIFKTFSEARVQKYISILAAAVGVEVERFVLQGYVGRRAMEYGSNYLFPLEITDPIGGGSSSASSANGIESATPNAHLSKEDIAMLVEKTVNEAGEAADVAMANTLSEALPPISQATMFSARRVTLEKRKEESFASGVNYMWVAFLLIGGAMVFISFGLIFWRQRGHTEGDNTQLERDIVVPSEDASGPIEEMQQLLIRADDAKDREAIAEQKEKHRLAGAQASSSAAFSSSSRVGDHRGDDDHKHNTKTLVNPEDAAFMTPGDRWRLRRTKTSGLEPVGPTTLFEQVLEHNTTFSLPPVKQHTYIPGPHIATVVDTKLPDDTTEMMTTTQQQQRKNRTSGTSTPAPPVTDDAGGDTKQQTAAASLQQLLDAHSSTIHDAILTSNASFGGGLGSGSFAGSNSFFFGGNASAGEQPLTALKQRSNSIGSRGSNDGLLQKVGSSSSLKSGSGGGAPASGGRTRRPSMAQAMLESLPPMPPNAVSSQQSITVAEDDL